MKLYKRYSRLKYRRIISRKLEVRLRWALKLVPGDIINDCSGFNKVLKEIFPIYRESKRGWAITGVDFTTEPYNGGCSLFHCGVEPEVPRDVLENHYESNSFSDDSIRKWYGEDTTTADKWIALKNKRINVVKSGGHFLDEHGVLLPEFER